ncbi:MAG: hypothetical protein FJW40_24355 [Acidobacteria bacterium]|nr:hypothetical protein [Acidobacteriota bacterium]
MKHCIAAGLLAAGLASGQSKPKDLCAPPPSAQAPSLPAKILAGQGKIDFPITTSNPKAREFFEQGVAQMHSFWAREAERSFLQAAALDPEAPMPHWGIAMVAAGDFRPRFQLDSQIEKFGKSTMSRSPRADAAAKEALELSAVPGKATDLEKLYIASVAARRDPASKDPDQGYIDGLRALVAKYPGEVEARSYLALHLMRGFVLPSKKSKGTSMESAQIIRQLLKDAPNHAGVHHYAIHGFEGSTFATDAWESCRRYAELVPNIPHALHMPGHIYSQTGRWQDAIKSFADAAENELGYMKADSLYGSGHHGHNVHYLSVSYSFSGNFDKAVEKARHLLSYVENPREASQVDSVYSTWRQGWFALMRALVQHEKWDLILDGSTLPVTDKPRLKAWRAWAVGIAHTARGAAAPARQELGNMEAATAEYAAKMKLPEPEELIAGREELLGHILIAEKQVDKGFKTIQEAVRKERALLYAEPPWYPRPAAEYGGVVAQRLGKGSLARKLFKEALEQYPASARSEAGLRGGPEKTESGGL